MRRTLLSASSLLALSATSALAQDSGFDWDGWYVGAQIGGSQHSATYEDIDYDWFGSTLLLQSLGGTVGVGGGYNIVSDNVLMGVAADLSYTSNSNEDIYSSDVQIQNDADLLATVRGRVGHVVGDTAIYTTAGLAYANFERSWTEFDDIPDTWPDLGKGKLGVALGFGLERAITERLSVAGTFQTALFGENTSVNPLGFPMAINDRINTVSLAFNYKLGDVVGAGVSTAPNGAPADFSGAYIGAGLGAAFADISSSDMNFDRHGGTYDVGNTGGIASVAAGYNWQLGSTVVGAEVNATAADLSEGYENDGGELETSMSTIVGLQGRAGVVAGDTMLYVLGGVSSSDVTNSFADGDADTSGTYTGLTVGAGVEQFISTNLALTGEASYTIFDGVAEDSTFGNPYQGHADLTALSFGVNYYLGGDRATGSGAAAPSTNWAGAYAGVEVSGLANKGRITDYDYDEFGGTFDVVSLGAGLGGHAGYNWQDGSLVYGVLADVGAFSNDQSVEAPGYREMVSTIKAMGSVRGRAGIATDNSLLYATGGLGFVVSDLAHYEPDASDPDSFDLSDTRMGAIVGLGVEHALSDNMSFKVETLYFHSAEGDYAQDPVQDCSGPSGFDGGDCEMTGIDSNISVKAGVSFRF